MKKTILAAALLGAMAFTAQAANVTMYGSVDAGSTICTRRAMRTAMLSRTSRKTPSS